MSPNENTQDRRHSDRFPIEREVCFRVMNKRGTDEAGDGKTLNISSSGVLFSTDQMLLPGRRLEVSINWPAQFDSKCALKLVARGRVVRFEQGRVAIEIQHTNSARRRGHGSCTGVFRGRPADGPVGFYTFEF